MAHIGMISPPVTAHVNGFCALGREIQRRGHKVTYFQVPDLEQIIKSEGIGYQKMGESDHPLGSLANYHQIVGRLSGIAALRFTIDAVRQETVMICRDLPDLARDMKIDLLLVDQMDPAGGTVAEHLDIPFVTICNALAINREWAVPPPFTNWQYRQNLFAKLRNYLGYLASDRALRTVTNVIGRHREKWGLKKHHQPDESFSQLAQISQQFAAFDFPRKKLPQCFHYVGPIRNASPKEIPFPWERLDGRPLIFGSLGSLQGGKEHILKIFAEACIGLDVQLVLSHGRCLTESQVRTIPGSHLIVDYAPQAELLKLATLTLSHGGLTTVLDSLANGVPLICIPLVYEQAAIANRVAWIGAGKCIAPEKLTVSRLRLAIEHVLSDRSYRNAAVQSQRAIQSSGGASRAVDIIETVLKTGKSVLRSIA